jgi:hypothetical protein
LLYYWLIECHVCVIRAWRWLRCGSDNNACILLKHQFSWMHVLFFYILHANFCLISSVLMSFALTFEYVIHGTWTIYFGASLQKFIRLLQLLFPCQFTKFNSELFK